MVYIYSLPSEVLQYPDIRNLSLKNYLNNNHIKNIYIDFVDYLINDILCKNSLIKNTIDDIRNEKINLLEANKKFLVEFNKFLNQYNLTFDRNYSFKKIIKNIDDLINISKDISKFIDLFPIEKYKNDDIVFLGVQYGYQLPFAICYAKRIKETNHNTKIILGGNYLTQIYDLNKLILSKIHNVDAIIIFGHGVTFLNIIKYYQGEKVLLTNTILKNNTEYIIKKDINDKYKNYSIDYRDINFDRYLARKRIMPVLLNYGCYYHKCNYCTHHFYYSNYIKLDTKKICDNILKEYNNNKFDCIVFLDECIPEEQILYVAKYFLDKKINTTWMMETRISKVFLNEENVKLLYRSGCRFISMGIESYNKRILRDMNKNIDIKDIKPILKAFFNIGIVTSATFMVGYPTENLFNIYKTLYFIKKNKYLDLFGLNVFKLVRNSILSLNMNIKFKDNNLVYIKDNKRLNKVHNILFQFKKNKKINRVENIKNMVLNRSDYLFINRECYSMNYRRINYE